MHLQHTRQVNVSTVRTLRIRPNYILSARSVCWIGRFPCTADPLGHILGSQGTPPNRTLSAMAARCPRRNLCRAGGRRSTWGNACSLSSRT